MKLSDKFWAIFDRVMNGMVYLAGIFIVLILLLVLYEVLMRYFFGLGQGWTIRIVEVTMLYVAFLSVAWLLKNHKHVTAELLYEQLNTKAKLYLDTFVSIIGIFVCLVMTYYSGVATVDNIARGILDESTLRLPRGIIISIMPLGFLMLTIEYARQFYGYLVHLRANRT